MPRSAKKKPRRSRLRGSFPRVEGLPFKVTDVNPYRAGRSFAGTLTKG